jgi:transposase
MRPRTYKVTLTDEERETLHKMISTGNAAARKLARARVVLACDERAGQPRLFDEEVAERVEVSCATVHRVRKAFVTEGLEAALNAKRPRQTRPPVFDGESEATLIALACSDPPEGRSRWTMRLLADRLVELEVFDSVSHETVRQVLKKTN